MRKPHNTTRPRRGGPPCPPRGLNRPGSPRLSVSPGLLVSLSLFFACTAQAHRTDEYLQDTTFLLERHQLTAWIRLTPGSDLLPRILPLIDTDSDGVISPGEQSAYANRVVRDLSLSLDGRSLTPRLASASFPRIEDMKEGLGEILIVFTAQLPEPTTPTCRLTFESHHEPKIAANLVNALIPEDPDIHIESQSRSYNQSHYELAYRQPLPPETRSHAAFTAPLTAAAVVVLALFVFLFHKLHSREVAPANPR